MRGGDLIREARLRAGLTQKKLANRLHTAQSVVARWEAGHHSPSFEGVVRAVRACGYDLDVSIVSYDPDHDRLISDLRALSPEQRLRHMLESQAAVQDLVHDARPPKPGA